MKYLFIVNPTAGGTDRTQEIREKAELVFSGRPDDEYEIYVTKCKGDDTAEVKRRAESGEELRILACGGDGTFNGCCNGAVGHMNVSVAPFPSGTGNDFCRMFGNDKDLFLNLEAILDGSTHPMDLALVNGMYSACIASCGFDARVGCNVHNYTHLPLCKGPGGYVASLIVEATKGLCMDMKIKCGDFTYDGPATLCCICNGRHYGGGFNPSPDAMPDDGILDIYLIEKISFLRFLTSIGKYKKGQGENTGIITHLRGDSISLEFDEETQINIDGEVLIDNKVDVKLIHHCMNLLVPKGITFFEK